MIFYIKKLLRSLDRFVIYLIKSKGAVKPTTKERAMEKTTFKIGDKITYSDDAEMAKKLGLDPAEYTGTITAIYENGERVDQSSNPFAQLITECNASAIASHATKVAA